MPYKTEFGLRERIEFMYSVIIVDYNSIKITMKYIETCLEKITESKRLHFVVVDNMPHSKSRYILETEMHLSLQEKNYGDMAVLCTKYKDAEVRVILTQKNLGYAKGNNTGIAFSEEEWADPYIVISNNDIEFCGKISLDGLCRVLEENDRAAAVGPHIEDTKGKLQGPYQAETAWNSLVARPVRVLAEFVFGPRETKKAAGVSYPSGEYYWISGCFFVGVREKLKQVGNFDENTFLYGEEMILSERLKTRGYTMYYVDDIRIVHRGSETIARSFKNFEAEETLYKSLYYYYKKYRKTSVFILLLSRVSFSAVKFLFGLGRRINHIFKIKEMP